jgi:hypothetical protein
MPGMSTSVLAGTEVRTSPASARPYLLGALAALSVGAAAIHFAVVFEHFTEDTLYGVFFLVIAWAQLIWPAVLLLWRSSRLWLWLGVAGNAVVIATYVASRTVGLPFGPDLHSPEPVGALDVVSCVLEFGLILGCAALLWRPSLADRPVARRGALASAAALAAVPVAVIAAATAVMTPGWAGPEGPAGMASAMASQSASSSSGASDASMGDMGTTDGHPDMQMYGSAAAPTAAQVTAAAQLITQTDASLKRYANVQAAFAAGYTYVLKTNGEEHLLYNGPDPAYQGLNPQDPSSLVYAINVPNHAPILLGAMYIMGDRQNGPQVGGGLTRWHSHLVTCDNGQQTIAGFGVQLRDGCNPATWQDKYTGQMLHVWVVPYPGGVFSDDLSEAATNSAVQAVLAQHS